MGKLTGYELAGKPLYTEKAVDMLESLRDSADEQLANGKSVAKPSYAFLNGEIETLQDYAEKLSPYHDVLQQGYEDISNVPRPETILGRIEEDMDLMARERDSRLEDTAPVGTSRREAFEQIFHEEEYSKPVLTDTWIIMNEAEKLRESI